MFFFIIYFYNKSIFFPYLVEKNAPMHELVTYKLLFGTYKSV